MLKIAFLGNQDNNAYKMCTWLRKAGYDAHLYIFDGNLKNKRSSPQLVDKDRDLERTPWIHFYDKYRKFYFLRKTELSREIERTYDVVVTSGGAVLSGLQYQDIPVVHMTLGSEVLLWPHQIFGKGFPLIERCYFYFTRKALAHSWRITNGTAAGMHSLNRLGLQKHNFFWGFPEDLDKNRVIVDRDLLASLNEKYGKYDRVFLWVSRLCMDPEIPFYKGADIFIRAFARALISHPNARAVIGMHGADVEKSKAFVEELGIADKVDWVPHLPFWELMTYLSLDNGVLVDKIAPEGTTRFGGSSREAVALGMPLVRSSDRSFISRKYGPDCPVILVNDENDVCEAMGSLCNMTDDEFKDLKAEFHDWAQAHLHYENCHSFLRFAKELENVVTTFQCETMAE